MACGFPRDFRLSVATILAIDVHGPRCSLAGWAPFCGQPHDFMMSAATEAARNFHGVRAAWAVVCGQPRDFWLSLATVLVSVCHAAAAMADSFSTKSRQQIRQLGNLADFHRVGIAANLPLAKCTNTTASDIAANSSLCQPKAKGGDGRCPPNAFNTMV